MTQTRQWEPASHLSAKDAEWIDLRILHERLAAEFCRLSILVGTVEHAVGECLASGREPSVVPVIALQGLDRVRQTLVDFHQLSKLVSAQISEDGSQAIEISRLREAFHMRENADRLLAPDGGGSAAPGSEETHELWDL